MYMDQELYRFIRNGEHRRLRQPAKLLVSAREYCAAGLSAEERMVDRFEKLCAAQQPILLKNEQICLMRSTSNQQLPDIFTKAEWDALKKEHTVHESGYCTNFCLNYGQILSAGLLKIREKADRTGQRAIDAVLNLTDRYRAAAEAQGRRDLAAVLKRVPRYAPQSFREALQFFRILHFALWLEGNYHITVGRLDQYLYPYFKKDLDAGLYTEESALALLEDFFLSFNKDNDLYPGVQQGDDGQSLVLGGVDENGRDAFNRLSALCLKASGNLKMIDPKINLRVGKSTPLRVYEQGSELTKAGLGFPQYSNDDVVIPGLVQLGYTLKDARNYCTAACWEFIVPGGMDVPNIGALSFPAVIDRCLHRDLPHCGSFAEFKAAVDREINAACSSLCNRTGGLFMVPSPLLNAVAGRDLSKGGAYNNYGFHGTGIATATDSLFAIKKYVFQEKTVSARRLINAVDSDFKNEPELLHRLRFETEKMGNDIDEVDENATFLLHSFAAALKGRKNSRGGIFRAGTGTAMNYLWDAQKLGASPDGRRKGEPLGANYSPSLFAAVNGPFSVIKSFTKPRLCEAINGGPLTLEFHRAMFQNSGSVLKLAQFVQSYILLGGHQLQLNAVDPEKLRDAQAHPEKYPHLIVRVWGWSAYFVDLEKAYQDHVIARQEYEV